MILHDVPLHCLVILLTDAPDWLAGLPPHEILRPESVLRDLVGPRGTGMATIGAQEMRRRCMLKLSLGERVVVPAAGLGAEDQAALGRAAEAQGASVLICGDGASAEAVQRLRRAVPGAQAAVGEIMPDVVDGLTDDPLDALYAAGWRGITVIPDIHGMPEPLERALAWARSRHHFVWCLGDFLDHGPASLACMEAIYRPVMAGQAGLLLGNHERKLARWLAAQDNPALAEPILGPANQRTVDALLALSDADRRRWRGRFGALLARSFLVMHMANVSLVHAAFHPLVWCNAASDRGLERFALFGQPDRRLAPPAFGLTYEWIDHVPAGQLAIVGHDTRSTVAPLAVHGARGGQVVFLDTGCGKGGPLCTADLRFAADQRGTLRLENFNSYTPA